MQQNEYEILETDPNEESMIIQPPSPSKDGRNKWF